MDEEAFSRLARSPLYEERDPTVLAEMAKMSHSGKNDAGVGLFVASRKL